MNDAQEFEAFVRAHEDLVFGVALRLLGSPTEAEDIAQVVFLKAFERFETLRSSPTVAGWLKTVARNLCLNHLSRYRKRWRLFSELGREDDEGEAVEQMLASQTGDERATEPAHDAEDVQRLLLALPRHQRVPLVLFHFEELSYQEIATELGVTVAKVKTDIHRARIAMRSQLEGRHE